jgi:hypothetical protein
MDGAVTAFLTGARLASLVAGKTIDMVQARKIHARWR